VTFVFATVQYESGDWDSAPLVPANVIDAVARYTDIPVAPSGVIVPLGSRDLLRYPFTWLTGHLPVRFSAAERANLAEYVERGGFLVVDDHNHDIDGQFHRTVTEEIERVCGPLEDVPREHRLYRAFFEFSDGPPATTHELNGWGDNLVHKTLKAVMHRRTGGWAEGGMGSAVESSVHPSSHPSVQGRISILYSNKDYSSEWSYHAVNKRFMSVDNTRFAVNLVVYALTR